MVCFISPRKSDFPSTGPSTSSDLMPLWVGIQYRKVEGKFNMAAIISTLSESCALRLLSATCCVFCVMIKLHGLYWAVSPWAYVALVLSQTNYHVLCCFLQLRANSANHNNIHAHLDFQTHNRNIVNLYVTSFIAPNSEANGMHHHKVLSADGLCWWFDSCCNMSLLEES